jgi:hypothetical protein
MVGLESSGYDVSIISPNDRRGGKDNQQECGKNSVSEVKRMSAW